MAETDPTAHIHPTLEVKGDTIVTREALSRDELTELGGAVLHAIDTVDLIGAREFHDELVDGRNPNVHGPGLFIQLPGAGVEMRAGSSYRSVDARAIEDLADSGVVRGAYTATGGERANTKGHKTYWSDGKEGSKHNFNTPSHMIIEAPTEALDAGWVTADQITAIHAKDSEGNVRDILREARDLATSTESHPVGR